MKIRRILDTRWEEIAAAILSFYSRCVELLCTYRVGGRFDILQNRAIQVTVFLVENLAVKLDRFGLL